MTRTAILFGLILPAFACGTSRSPVAVSPADLGPVPAGAARVCVLRPDASATDVTMEVRDNGRLVGATRGLTFFCYLAEPGEHQIVSADDDTGPTILDARAGGRYWIHQDVTAFAGKLHGHLDFVDEAAALDMVDACEQRVLYAVPGHENGEAVPVASLRRARLPGDLPRRPGSP